MQPIFCWNSPYERIDAGNPCVSPNSLSLARLSTYIISDCHKKSMKLSFLSLYRLHIISPGCMWAKSLISEGISLMALLRFAAYFYPHCCAITDEKQLKLIKALYPRQLCWNSSHGISSTTQNECGFCLDVIVLFWLSCCMHFLD